MHVKDPLGSSGLSGPKSWLCLFLSGGLALGARLHPIKQGASYSAGQYGTHRKYRSGGDSWTPGGCQSLDVNDSYNVEKCPVVFFVGFFEILFIRERQRHRLHAGSPMGDLIPGPQDHALGRRRR